MTKLLDVQKQKIYQLLEVNPGLHLSKIAELLSINITIVEQQLNDLEQDEVLITTQDAGYKRYYINEREITVHAKKISETRTKIVALVTEHPGLNLTTVAEMLQLRISLVEYYLFFLEKNGTVVGVKDRGLKRYYLKNSPFGSDERVLFGLLRQEIPLKIILLLLRHKNLQHKDLLKYFDLAPSTLSYHINKLLKEGVIDVQTYGAERGYVIKNKATVVEFLTKYKLHKMVDTFTDTWGDLTYGL